tara:strand:+ start:1396 stop:2355 length:960 start_codon:yes stop_codon:yes gene_type:complete
MAQIRMQDVMAAYAPAVNAFDINKGREQAYDQKEINANINFDDRIQRQALPVSRMLNSDNSLNLLNIKNAGKGFESPHSMWNEISSQMPKGRSLDPVVFQQKYAMGKQMYDLNAMNQIGQMQESGMSMRKIRKALKINPEFYDYALQNSFIPRERTVNFGGIAKGIGSLGASIGAGYGIDRGLRATLKAKPTLSAVKELRSLGFKVKNVNGKRVLQELTDKELYNKPSKVRGAKNAAKAVEQAEADVIRKKAGRSMKLRNDKLYKKAAKGNRSALNKILVNSGVRLKGLKGLASRGKVGMIAGVGSAGILGLIDYLKQE